MFPFFFIKAGGQVRCYRNIVRIKTHKNLYSNKKMIGKREKPVIFLTAIVRNTKHKKLNQNISHQGDLKNICLESDLHLCAQGFPTLQQAVKKIIIIIMM